MTTISVIDANGRSRPLPRKETVRRIGSDVSEMATEAIEAWCSLRDEMWEMSRSGDPSGRTGTSDPTLGVVLRHEDMGEHLRDAASLLAAAQHKFHQARGDLRGVMRALAKARGRPEVRDTEEAKAGENLLQEERDRLAEAQRRRRERGET